MLSLWFIVPVHGRAQLASICLRQLRRTCDALLEEGVEATAVVIGDRHNLRELRELDGLPGFATLERTNHFTSRKFNDGIQLACDPNYNPRPADYVVPFGSDDWADHRLFIDLPEPRTVVGFQHMSFVSEDGREMTCRHLKYQAGSGIRIYPRALMEAVGYRPADEDRKRGCDTSILANLTMAHQQIHVDDGRYLHDRQLVDWKTPGGNLNDYDSLRRHKMIGEPVDPFEALADYYPAEALAEMQTMYALAPAVAA